jgi:acetyl esterase
MPAHSSIIFEPVTARYLLSTEAKDAEHIHEHPVDEARRLAETPPAVPVVKLPANIQDILIPGGPTGEVRVRIMRPKDVSGLLPVVVYFHGGGWILGGPSTYDRAMREIAHGAHAAVAFVDYARSPEVRYPVAIEQAYAVARYVADHAMDLQMDGTRLALVGDSAGGNMAAAVALLAKQRGRPNFRLQALLYPALDPTMSTESYATFAQGPWLTQASMEWFWSAYAPDLSAHCEPTLNPLTASLDQLRDLPPALVITAENDVLCDESEAYARKLMQAGVAVVAVRYVGTTHGFVTLDALAESPSARNAMALLTATLRGAWAA